MNTTVCVSHPAQMRSCSAGSRPSCRCWSDFRRPPQLRRRLPIPLVLCIIHSYPRICSRCSAPVGKWQSAGGQRVRVPMGGAVATSARSPWILRSKVFSKSIVYQEAGLYYVAELTNGDLLECCATVNTTRAIDTILTFLDQAPGNHQRSAAAILRNITSEHHCGKHGRPHAKILVRCGAVDLIVAGAHQ